jgi:hypothetical protein
LGRKLSPWDRRHAEQQLLSFDNRRGGNGWRRRRRRLDGEGPLATLCTLPQLMLLPPPQCAHHSQESAHHPLGCTRVEHLQRTPESVTMSTPAPGSDCLVVGASARLNQMLPEAACCDQIEDVDGASPGSLVDDDEEKMGFISPGGPLDRGSYSQKRVRDPGYPDPR